MVPEFPMPESSQARLILGYGTTPRLKRRQTARQGASLRARRRPHGNGHHSPDLGQARRARSERALPSQPVARTPEAPFLGADNVQAEPP